LIKIQKIKPCII